MNQPTSRAEYAAQGKSNNFVNAEAAGHLAAGQAAKVLSKRLGCKITAKQIEPLASEFHHCRQWERCCRPTARTGGRLNDRIDLKFAATKPRNTMTVAWTDLGTSPRRLVPQYHKVHSQG